MAPKFCENCGHALTARVKFCPECGHAISGDAKASREAVEPLSSSHYFWLGLVLLASLIVGGAYYYDGFQKTVEGKSFWGQQANEHHHPGDGHNHPPIPEKPSAEVMRQAAMAVEENPNDAEANTRMGNLLFDSGMFSEAMEYYEKSLEIEPNNPDVIVDLGVCYYNTSDFARAEYHFKQALDNTPGHVNALYNLGIVSLQNKNVDQLKSAWGELIKVAPGSQQATRAMQYLQNLHDEVQDFQQGGEAG